MHFRDLVLEFKGQKWLYKATLWKWAFLCRIGSLYCLGNHGNNWNFEGDKEWVWTLLNWISHAWFTMRRLSLYSQDGYSCAPTSVCTTTIERKRKVWVLSHSFLNSSIELYKLAMKVYRKTVNHCIELFNKVNYFILNLEYSFKSSIWL